MKFKHFVAATSLALMPLAASAASIYIPAAGTGPGANDSQWQTELTLHNTSSRTIALGLVFHDQQGPTAPVSLSLAPRATESIADVVKNRFGREVATGALEITLPDADAVKVAVTSRTFNVNPAGEFGQDIPAYAESEVATAGDIAVIAGPSSIADYRFNFGVYAVADASVRWELLRADGTVAATKDVQYVGGRQVQYTNGVASLLNTTAGDNDVIHATVLTGRALFYGSAIHQRSGDPTFVPAVRAREDVRINFAGIDVDENGTIDIADADRDGVLDSALDVFTNGFPNYFRVIATGENGQAVTYELIEAPADATFVDAQGTVSYAPGGNLRGSTGTLKVRATSGSTSVILTIPVHYR